MSQRRSHEPKGTYVRVIRHEHGWHDGSISGYLIDDNDTVRIDSDDSGHLAPANTYTLVCEHRRDYEPCDPPADKRSKTEKRRAENDARRAAARAARGTMKA